MSEVPAAADVDQYGRSILVHRLQYLQLVQQIAHEDVERCIEAVGLEALTFRGATSHPVPAMKWRPISTPRPASAAPAAAAAHIPQSNTANIRFKVNTTEVVNVNRPETFFSRTAQRLQRRRSSSATPNFVTPVNEVPSSRRTPHLVESPTRNTGTDARRRSEPVSTDFGQQVGSEEKKTSKLPADVIRAVALALAMAHTKGKPERTRPIPVRDVALSPMGIAPPPALETMDAAAGSPAYLMRHDSTSPMSGGVISPPTSLTAEALAANSQASITNQQSGVVNAPRAHVRHARQKPAGVGESKDAHPHLPPELIMAIEKIEASMDSRPATGSPRHRPESSGPQPLGGAALSQSQPDMRSQPAAVPDQVRAHTVVLQSPQSLSRGEAASFSLQPPAQGKAAANVLPVSSPKYTSMSDEGQITLLDDLLRRIHTIETHTTHIISDTIAAGHVDSTGSQRAVDSDLPASHRPRAKRLRGALPPAMVRSILENRELVHEVTRYNERLWNTTAVSQVLFADRLTDALLDDMLSEVTDELQQVLDGVVDNLVVGELELGTGAK